MFAVQKPIFLLSVDQFQSSNVQIYGFLGMDFHLNEVRSLSDDKYGVKIVLELKWSKFIIGA